MPRYSDSVSSMSRRLDRRVRRGGGSAPAVPRTRGHRFIDIGRYHRNERNAEAYVLALVKELDPSARLDAVRGRILAFGEREHRFEVNFREAVESARIRGTAEALRTYVNGADPYFPFSVGVTTDGEGPTIGVGFAGKELKLAAPMRQFAIEDELADDVLEHRRKCTEHAVAAGDGFRTCALHFRACVLSSTALLEAFLSRAVLVSVAGGKSSPALTELQRPCSVERRFELWLGEFCGEPLASINRGSEWSDYQQLRALRNALTHPTDPMLGIEIKAVARDLNLVRRGVGGLMNALRRLQQLRPVPFAERLETAPETRFVSRVGRT